jgi:ABC-type glutathione transport system ATPase component
MAKKDRRAEKRRANAKESRGTLSDEETATKTSNDDGSSCYDVSISPVRKSAEELGFQLRTGPTAPKNRTQNQDIEINDVCVCAGRNELLANTTLKLVYGQKYGLVGRNGVGKSTLLRAIIKREGIPIPDFVFTMHVEQEIQGNEVSVLQTVLQANKEREYLLAVERALLNIPPEETTESTRVDGICLMEVYERLEELDSENAEAKAATILAGKLTDSSFS